MIGGGVVRTGVGFGFAVAVGFGAAVRDAAAVVRGVTRCVERTCGVGDGVALTSTPAAFSASVFLMFWEICSARVKMRAGSVPP
jgi:hypothetical protein